jgi:glycosyltransferase involved in cell wall biosynthesis
MKFSIIIPTYKRLELLEKAVACVKNQTYQNLEIIIVNDSPEDRLYIESLFGGLDKVTVIHHERSKGGSAARNTGILNSSGELIAFLDDDDIWLPEKLARHLEAHERYHDAGVVFSDCLYIYNNNLIQDHKTSYNLTENVVGDMAKAKFCPATSSMVTIKRKCITTCGLFDEGLESFQDWDYWFRIAHHYRFIYIPEVLVHFIQHIGDRTSQNEEKRQKGLRQICAKWGNAIEVKSFSRYFTRSIYYKNSLNALLAGEETAALKNSLKLLKKKVIGVKSIKSIFGLLRLLILKKWSNHNNSYPV